MLCPGCGEPVIEGDHFCRRCGRPLLEPAAEPRRRPPWLAGSSVALLLIALVLFFSATNPSPAAYAMWLAGRMAPAASTLPDGFALAVARATEADSYGVCTIFRTETGSGQVTVLGVLGQFLPLGQGPAAVPANAPGPGSRQRRGRQRSGGVQI